MHPETLLDSNAAGHRGPLPLMPLRRLTALAAVFLTLALTPVAGASLSMYMGAAEDEGRNGDPLVAAAKMELAHNAGFGAIRVTALWKPGMDELPPDQLEALRSAAGAADFDGIKIVATIMPVGSSVTPLTAAARNEFADFAADVVARTTIREVIVGNEPNLNRYWMPQFGPKGGDVAAIAYTRLLAQAYDAIKAAEPTTFVLGGSVSPRGSDRPDLPRQTHSPTAFITDMGAAYRASKRTAPLMDGFAFHPYGETSSTPPDFLHPKSTSIGLGDYPKLVSLLGRAFNGTATRGSALPIVYDEYGIDSRIPAAKRGFYKGREPVTTHPVAESTQAEHYREALMLAACQPTVRGFLIFHVTDETDFNRWQSGVYYADGTPKTSLPLVRSAIEQVRDGAVACSVDPGEWPGRARPHGSRLTIAR
jgi:hypothetical protein